MSYLVLARKWRPIAFDDVVGQEHITNTLRKAIEIDRVAHAFIFSGTRGVGKTTTARILARALNCVNGPTPDPCGTCDMCRGIMSGSSFDVVEVDGASNNRVEDIRELRNNVQYSSMGGKYRVFVIDEAHMLTRPAFNALLKTLEEPPQNVIFIFATTEPYKIPETIHSRCQRYDFRRISNEQILRQLENICSRENVRCDRKGLAILARRADGSMRDALSLLDQVYSFCRDNISESDVRSVLGLVDREVYATIMNGIVERNPLPVLESVQHVLYQGYELHEFMIGLEEYLRTILVMSFSPAGQESRLDLPVESDEDLQHFRNHAGQFDDGTVLRMIEIVRKAEFELKWASIPRFTVELALLKLVYLDRSVSIEELLKLVGREDPGPRSDIGDRVSEESKKKSPSEPALRHSALILEEPVTPVVPQSPESAEMPEPEILPQKNPHFDPSAERDWLAFVDFFMQEHPRLGSFLSCAHASVENESDLVLTFPAQFTFQLDELRKAETRTLITDSIKGYCGKDYILKLSDGGSHPRLHDKADPVERFAQSELDEAMEKEPVIKFVIDTFGGEIL